MFDLALLRYLSFSLLFLGSCSIWQTPSRELHPLHSHLQGHWPDLSELHITYWPADAPARYQNQLLQLRFQIPAATRLSEAEIRSVLEPWLLEQQHPEALCLSIEMKAHDNRRYIQLDIVCRI